MPKNKIKVSDIATTMYETFYKLRTQERNIDLEKNDLDYFKESLELALDKKKVKIVSDKNNHNCPDCGSDFVDIDTRRNIHCISCDFKDEGFNPEHIMIYGYDEREHCISCSSIDIYQIEEGEYEGHWHCNECGETNEEYITGEEEEDNDDENNEEEENFDPFAYVRGVREETVIPANPDNVTPVRYNGQDYTPWPPIFIGERDSTAPHGPVHP